MPVAARLLPAGSWDRASACDRIALDHDARHRRRFHYVAAGGTAFLLDLPRAAVLAEGDGLALDDGRVIAVEAAPEPLMEARAPTPGAMMRLAWHIGNRHLPAQLGFDVIRLRRDHVIRDMLEGLGAEVVDVEAPFTPEQGAYAGGGGHAHGHHHRHHEHDHAH
ncbi:urease accessory protein UreE [Sphingomonas spermidinifaciens]|uniref:Urease accessory protein UreE n=1 Tax=Sphingomonas spermidinifaciens TaxID=1141889 RepID=A0A2A4B2C7_9SPHN|nr:urease accessory protein UreE [Sphingomonas spermidinifaciens]PCD02092.1 urease accessory protein UreE [Sphingomonas spermidinifaciens]